MSSNGSGKLVWLGISLGVFASMTGTIGKQLLRFSAMLEKRRLKYNAKIALTCGLLLNALVGPLVDMASYAFAPQSIIAPLAGLDVVWNTLTAPCTLGEKLTYPVVFGVVLIAGGATGTSFFGNHNDPDYDVEMIKDKFNRMAVLLYSCLLVVWLLFNIFCLQRRNPLPPDAVNDDEIPAGTPSENSLNCKEKFVKGDWKDTIRGLSLGMTAGSIAGNMFCVKGFIELVQASIRDEDSSIWADYLPYVLFVGALVFALSNLYFLTKATREYEALFMGAVFEGTAIVTGAVSGIVVYSDLEGVEWHRRIGYFVTLASILAGVLIVAFNSSSSEQKEIDTQTEKMKEALRESGETGEHVVYSSDQHSRQDGSARQLTPTICQNGSSAQVMFRISVEDNPSSPAPKMADHAEEKVSTSAGEDQHYDENEKFVLSQPHWQMLVGDEIDIEEPKNPGLSKQEQGEQMIIGGVASKMDDHKSAHRVAMEGSVKYPCWQGVSCCSVLCGPNRPERPSRAE